MALETGYDRDYGSGVVYKNYFASEELAFPAVVRDESRIKKKGYVFGLRDFARAKAWPLEDFAGGKVINDTFGEEAVVLIGNAEDRSVRAYQRGDEKFAIGEGKDSLLSESGLWHISEEALEHVDGRKLARLPGHVAYWFAWENYFGGASLAQHSEHSH